jgi:hypothetical protein
VVDHVCAFAMYSIYDYGGVEGLSGCFGREGGLKFSRYTLKPYNDMAAP